MLPLIFWMVSRADVCYGQVSIFSAVLHSEHVKTTNRNDIAIMTSDAFVKCRQVRHSNHLGTLHLGSTFDRAYLGDDILEVWNFLYLEVCF